MAARPVLETRGFGGEASVPTFSEIADRLESLSGTEADLVTLRLLDSLRSQVDAGLATVSGGGRFYRDRWLEGIGSVVDGVLRGDPDPRPSSLEMDARALSSRVRTAWATAPAPSELGLIDRYYRDPEEAGAAVRDAYRGLMRRMRDAGVVGHVLLVTSPAEEEIEDLASPMTYLYCPDPSGDALDLLLEHQRPLALVGRRVAELAGLMDQYGRRPVYLIDPTEEEVRASLEVLDTDHIRVGGLCPGDCDAYWQRLAAL
ncbi:hypothetical protein DSECCO2_616110 [anaerobic digester metagenome]